MSSRPPLDTVDLLINGKEVLCAKEYDVSRAFFTVPDTFSLTIGSGKTSLELEKEVPPGSLFALRINGVVQFTGYTDGFERFGGGATEIVITGRDIMAQLLRDHIEHERSFNNATFQHLAEEAIRGAGIAGFSLVFDAAAQRAAVAGVPVLGDVQVPDPPVFRAEIKRLQALAEFRAGAKADIRKIEAEHAAILAEADKRTKTVQGIVGYRADKPIKWDAGETWFAALKKDFDRAGIFLRAGVDPDGNDPNIFLLSAPDGNQAAAVWLLNTRREDTPENAVLVGPPQVRKVTTTRHTDYVVLGQAGGGKDGHRAVEGRFHDDEAAALLPLPAKLVKKDSEAKNTRQANFLARKMRAEECRANQSFVYPILHRHTVPLIKNPAQRVIIGPDMVVHLRDDERGIDGPMWVERVRHHSSVQGGTFTEITLIDPQHLLFGEDEVTRPVPPRAAPKHHRRST